MGSNECYRLLATQLPKELLDLAIPHSWFQPMQGQQQ